MIQAELESFDEVMSAFRGTIPPELVWGKRCFCNTVVEMADDLARLYVGLLSRPEHPRTLDQVRIDGWRIVINSTLPSMGWAFKELDVPGCQPPTCASERSIGMVVWFGNKT